MTIKIPPTESVREALEFRRESYELHKEAIKNFHGINEFKPKPHDGNIYSADGVDQCRMGDLDLDGMLAERQKQIREGRMQAFEAAVENSREHPAPETAFMLEPDAFEKWDLLSVQSKDAEKHLRGVWEAKGKTGSFSDFIDAEKAQGCPRAFTLRLAGSLGYGSMFGISTGQTMQQAIDTVAPLITFAVLMDGKWYERGQMGWWACVSDEDDQWDSKFKGLFESLPADKILTVVDCHI